ncbi:potassium channel family protein [Nocardioides sp. GCM10027113]|uniref:potassium channel family protein n=1 Tax=unclassified Nocardioides TaxID=2615069 RepID=UPI003622F3D9
MSEPTRVDRWERRTEWPLAALAVVFLVAYAWPILDPDLSPDVKAVLLGVEGVVWLAFAVDLVARLLLVEGSRLRYAVRHWYDVIVVVVPLLRPLRLLRLIALVKVLNRTAVASLSGRVTTYVAGTAVFSLGLGALTVLDAERGAEGANITTFGDALWWSLTTVSTVGYGDHFPVTLEGRLVAAGLMLVGIAVIGVITASVAAWLVHNVEEEPSPDAG